MIINFQTKDFGIIETDTVTRKVYFRTDDIEVNLNEDNSFQSIKGEEFRILFVSKGYVKLQVLTYFTIAQEKLS